MTNDQKLLHLIHAVDELIKAQEKAEMSGASFIAKDDAKKKRSALKIWLAGNKVVTVPTTKIKKNVYVRQEGFNKNNWLAR